MIAPAGALLLALAPAPAQAGTGVMISEFVAANANGIVDQDGDRPDWIELYNGGAAAVDLGGWYLTDSAGNKTKWRLPAPALLPPGGFLLIFASDKDRAVAGQELHANFKLDAGGEYLALVQADGSTVAHEYAPRYPQQYLDVGYGLAFQAGPPTAVYFQPPTPGLPNGRGGLFVSETVHAPAQPGDADALTVQARVAGAQGALQYVELRYRIGYGATSTTAMHDDGLHGDAMAGDGIYTGAVPAAAAGPGEMLRYYVAAADGAGTARAPLFNDPDDSAEYFGVVIADPALTSALPIVHWFVENPQAANTPVGTRCSLWFDGEFYDNVRCNARGGSSQVWPKKSYKFDFNPGAHFRYDPAQPRVEELNLNSTWSDKAYVRQTLAWETYLQSGCVGSLSFPLRLQQNGAFFSVAVLVEEPDETYLERNGLDPNGAFYKMYNPCTSSTSGVEKVTRTWEGNQDLQGLIDGIQLAGAARAQYLFDHVDIPACINYVAATTVMHDNDHVGKNYYLYRDSDGDGEWRFAPWDKDLTFGRNYNNFGGVLNDVMWADDDPYGHPLFGDQFHRKVDNIYNRLIDALHQTPEIQELYLRRLRTLMDARLQAPNLPVTEWRYEARIDELHAAMAPDVALDQAKWGLPSWGTRQLDFAAALVQLENEYLAPRRQHLYVAHGPRQGGIIPAEQESFPQLGFGAIEAAPSSGDPLEEFVEIRNPSASAVDVSGWRLAGGIDFAFAPGTVVGAGRSLYVSPSLPAFRARATAPHGGQGLLVVGPSAGELAPGEILNLLDADGWLVNTTAGPALAVRDLVAGRTATLQVAGTTPNAAQWFGYSLAGGGPTHTSYGPLLLSPPILALGSARADAAGIALLDFAVPAAAAGRAVWFQARDAGGPGRNSNGLAEVVR